LLDGVGGGADGALERGNSRGGGAPAHAARNSARTGGAKRRSDISVRIVRRAI
jgi:hypothetical protein